MQKKEFLEDVKAFGGLPLFLAVIFLSFSLGYSVLGVRLGIALVLAYFLTAFIRFVFFRQRPDKQKFKGFAQKIDASSFPSLHSMRASCFAFLVALFFSNFLVTCLMIVAAVSVALVRVLQKRHFASDVVAGLILGVFVALAAVWLQVFLF